MSEELKAYQPQYFSNIQREFCDVHGYRDDQSKNVVMAKNSFMAKDLFVKWLAKRCKTHNGLSADMWKDYVYYMERVEL